MMADAIQKSYAMIIVVSPEYKESPNCRLEARYARAREVNNLLKIIYVMVDSQYHTRSSPRLEDGWLGAMVGSELRYPLWEKSQIEGTAKSIAERVGNHADYNKNRAFVARLPTVKDNSMARPTSPVSSKGMYGYSGPDYHKAWTFLENAKNSKYAKNPDSLEKLLDDIGIYKADDLAGLDTENLESIAGVLKLSASNIFREALQLKRH